MSAGISIFPDSLLTGNLHSEMSLLISCDMTKNKIKIKTKNKA